MNINQPDVAGLLLSAAKELQQVDHTWGPGPSGQRGGLLPAEGPSSQKVLGRADCPSPPSLAPYLRAQRGSIFSRGEKEEKSQTTSPCASRALPQPCDWPLRQQRSRAGPRPKARWWAGALLEERVRPLGADWVSQTLPAPHVLQQPVGFERAMSLQSDNTQVRFQLSCCPTV